MRRSVRWFFVCVIALFVVFLLDGTGGRFGGTSLLSSAPVLAQDSGHGKATAEPHKTEAGHEDPFSPILLILAIIILAAVFGRWAAGRLNMPPVLGELLIGVIIGNVGYWFGEPLFVIVMHLNYSMDIFNLLWNSGISIQDAVQQVFTPAQLGPDGIGTLFLNIFSSGHASLSHMTYAVWLFSNLGVILLLFMVGLESSVEGMLKVGKKASIVATVGVVAPFFLGFLLSSILLPEATFSVHLFLGATLSATSVGITARVLKDLHKLQTPEAKVILGAAVIDDVMGLIILAIVAGIASTGHLVVGEMVRIILISIGFLVVILFFGEKVFHWIIKKAGRFERESIKLLLPLTLAFLMAWLSSFIGLAAIVGAFAAGLLLREEFFGHEHKPDETMEALVAPLEKLFAPVFFVLMGMQVDLNSFLHPETMSLALAFIVAAIIGKVVAGYAVGGLDKLSVGIGMVPRGEVGLIFASIGKGLGVVTDAVFSAVVIMVIVTTLITPVGLKWSLARGERKVGV